ncbi:MAG: zf-HC2 domain-containing protein [Gemmatimonadetes bacterium]|nr:zf-HC2 domain-containing protein [Gemmatimonadota bacterium]
MNDQWTDRLSAYLDGELPPGERVALDAHLAGCAACRATVDELRRVMTRAQTLEDRPPAADLWPGIAARIGLATGHAGQVVSLAERRARRRLVFSIPQAIAAGVALMLVSGGSAWLLLRPRGPATPVAVAPQAPAPGPVTTVRWPTAASRYDEAIAQLELALAAGRGRLDTATVRVLEQNLALIDRAIAQARAALAADPADAYLNHHLADTMRRKLQLLRRANTLATARS